jgi:predicted RNase H-like nuclease (RuvC/YqgF family)
MATQRKKMPSALKKPRTSKANGANPRGCAECERLKQTVRRLRAARKQDRRRMAELEKERDDYRDTVYGFLHKEFPYREEDWKDFRLEDYNIPLSQMIEEVKHEFFK